MNDNDVTLGEIGRAVKRIEAQLATLTKDVSDALVTASTLNLRMKTAETDIERIDGDVKAVSTQAARISGAVGLLAFISSLVPWPWKH